MILQSSYGCYLTQCADIPMSERQFITNTFIPDAEAAQAWMEITEREKEDMLARNSLIDVNAMSYQSLTAADQVLKGITANINNIALTPAQALEMSTYYPDWSDIIGTEISSGFRFRRDEVLYESLVDHTVQADNAPGRARIALYKVVTVEPDPVEPVPEPEPIPDPVPEESTDPDSVADPESIPEEINKTNEQ